MGSSVQPEVDPLEALKALKAAQQNDPLAQLKALKAGGSSTPVTDGNPLHAEYAKGLLANRMQRENQNEQEQAANETLNPVQRGLVGIANTAGGIPGVEAAQAFAASKVNGIPYSEAYRDIKNAEGDLSGVGRFLTRGAGAAVAAPLLPGGAAAQGAAFGAASGLLNADPSAGVGHRLLSGAGQAALGYGVGRLAEGLTTLGRAAKAPTPGAQALEQEGQMGASDAARYGLAKTEAQAVGTSPKIQAVLADPVVKPYADAVRSYRQFANADDATVLQEAYKLMSEHQRTLGSQLARSPENFRATSQAAQDELGLVKQDMLTAADEATPSLRGAVQEHARLAGEQDAAKVASDAARRIMRGAATPAKKLTTDSPEAIMQQIVNMRQNEAQAAKDALLARLRERAAGSLRLNPFKGFGIPQAISSGARLSPFVNAASQAAGGSGADAALQALLASLPSTQINR